MLLTKPQVTLFWREWKTVCISQGWTRENGWTAEQINQERYSLIREATGHDSLTAVGSNNDFTDLLEAMAVLKSDLNGVRHAELNPRRQLIWRIRKAPAAYWQKIAQDRFGNSDLDSLTDEQLTQLRNTLADRNVGQHRNSTRRIRNDKARTRRAEKASQPARITFPDHPSHESHESEDATEAWWEQEALKESEAFEREESRNQEFYENQAVESHCHSDQSDNPF